MNERETKESRRMGTLEEQIAKQLPVLEKKERYSMVLYRAFMKDMMYNEKIGVYLMENGTYLMVYDSSSFENKVLPIFRIVDKKGKRLFQSFDNIEAVINFYK